MASFKRRGNVWQVQVCKKGVRASSTFNTKAESREWANKTEADIALHKSGKIGFNKTLGDAFDKYLVEVSPQKKGHRWEAIRLNAFKKYIISDVKMSDLSAADIANYRDTRLLNVSGATVNRELNLISALLNRAKMEWGWINHNPVSQIRRPKNPRPRDVRIDDFLKQRVLDALGYDGEINNKKQLVAVYFLIALETAMRLGEICNLTVPDFFADGRYVVIRDSKNGDHRHVALSRCAVVLLSSVFESGVIVNRDVASALFYKYCKKAEIERLNFHDTRHEALTQLAQKLDVLDLARMVGHRDPKSLMIYYNATASEIASRLD